LHKVIFVSMVYGLVATMSKVLVSTFAGCGKLITLLQTW
jgi:hypothetical protein